jgi:hypothetical protein
MMRKPRAKAITVRDLPAPVARAVRRKAQKDRSSVNRAVVRLLEEATGQHRPPEPPGTGGHDDLDDFSGRWSKKEADAFDAYLREQRKVDPEMWK